jgi:hypothetical protein
MGQRALEAGGALVEEAMVRDATVLGSEMQPLPMAHRAEPLER